MKTVLSIFVLLITLISSAQAQTMSYQFTTSPATNITQSSATISGFSSGSVLQTWVAINVGGGNVPHFGQINGPGQVTGNVTGLACGTTYFFEVEGTVANGTTNGAPLSFATLSCSGGSGAVQITNFNANPAQVTNGSNTVLTWSSTGASACMIDGSTLGTSGSQSFGPIFGTRSYTIRCFNSQGVSDYRTVTVSSDGGSGAVQITVSTPISTSAYAVFGETNVSLGQTSFTAGPDKVTITSLKYKVRECSNWSTLAIPFSNYTLSNGSTIIAGTESTVDGERVVTFQAGSTIRQNITATYTMHADVRTYNEALSLNKQCFRMALERAGVGVDAKTQVLGNFPIRHSAETLVRSKPTVTLLSMGVPTNRVRVASDDVAKLIVSANNADSITINEVVIRPSNAGGEFPTAFKLIDDSTGVEVPGALVSTGGMYKFVMRNPEFVTQGSAKVYRVRVDSTTFANTPSTADVISFELRKSSDFRWNTYGDDDSSLGLEDGQLRQRTSISYE